MIAIIDYDRGNLFSIGRALDQFGASYCITDDLEKVSKASKIILPGVGSFGDAMTSLHQKSLASAIVDAAGAGVPMFGICLGMQLFATKSDEFGSNRGLDLIPGTVRRLPAGVDIRVPNVGWRPLEKHDGSQLSSGFYDREMMYFVHSFAYEPERNDDIAATIEMNGKAVTAMVRHKNIIGCQFHPEKSGPAGLRLIQWFLEQ